VTTGGFFSSVLRARVSRFALCLVNPPVLQAKLLAKLATVYISFASKCGGAEPSKIFFLGGRDYSPPAPLALPPMVFTLPKACSLQHFLQNKTKQNKTKQNKKQTNKQTNKIQNKNA